MTPFHKAQLPPIDSTKLEALRQQSNHLGFSDDDLQMALADMAQNQQVYLNDQYQVNVRETDPIEDLGGLSIIYQSSALTKSQFMTGVIFRKLKISYVALSAKPLNYIQLNRAW